MLPLLALRQCPHEPVAVGMALTGRPHTDPAVRHYRTGLLSWVATSQWGDVFTSAFSVTRAPTLCPACGGFRELPSTCRLSFAVHEKLGILFFPFPDQHFDAARLALSKKVEGFTSCYGLLCSPFSGGYLASVHPVTQRHRMPAPWPPDSYPWTEPAEVTTGLPKGPVSRR